MQKLQNMKPRLNGDEVCEHSGFITCKLQIIPMRFVIPWRFEVCAKRGCCSLGKVGDYQ